MSNALYQRERRKRQKQSSSYFVYALCEPNTLIIRYVGRTWNVHERLMGHIAEARLGIDPNKQKSAWVNSLLAKDQIPTIQILEETTKAESPSREKYWIRFIHKEGGKLLNNPRSLGIKRDGSGRKKAKGR